MCESVSEYECARCVYAFKYVMFMMYNVRIYTGFCFLIATEHGSRS